MNAPSPTDTDRRTTILDAAVESFGKLGYYGTSLQRIATEVGLTKAGVLHYVVSCVGCAPPAKISIPCGPTARTC